MFVPIASSRSLCPPRRQPHPPLPLSRRHSSIGLTWLFAEVRPSRRAVGSASGREVGVVRAGLHSRPSAIHAASVPPPGGPPGGRRRLAAPGPGPRSRRPRHCGAGCSPRTMPPRSERACWTEASGVS
jgi:hypothetical protein